MKGISPGSYKVKISTLAPNFLKYSVAFILASLILPGCAVYYRDRDSGAEHIWGFGHLSMKVIPPGEGKQAIVQRSTLTGAAVGIDNGSLGISVGYDQREHILIYDENLALTIQRPPSNDFFYFKIGSYPLEFENLPNADTSPERKENHP